jgi:putative lysine transport system substrate-binding protein
LAVVTPVALTACGGKSGDSEVLRVGMEAAYAPFNWTQGDDSNGAVPIEGGGYAGGYDVQIAKLVADKLDRELVVVKTAWEGLIPALQAGKIDMIVAGMTPTDVRREAIDFSDPYYTSDVVIVVKKDSALAKATSLSDFAGAKITGQLGTKHYDEFLGQIPDVDQGTALEDFPTMILALESGKVDGYISERPGALSAQASHPSLTFVEFEEGEGFDVDESDTALAVGLKKGSPLREQINGALASISPQTRQELMDQAVKDQPIGE